MYYTDTTELVTAVKNIEKNELKRVVRKFGGSYTFPEDQRPLVELYSNGPTSAEIASVRIDDESDLVMLDAPELGAEVASCVVYAGHLFRITQRISELEAA